MTDVFVSYCRRNKEFVHYLNKRLTDDGRDTWVDWEDIPPNADWRTEIAEGIEATRTVLFVLSPEWLASYECGVELDLALKHNKRLLPIVCDEVQYKEVRPELASLNWIFFRKTDDFEQAYQALSTALDTDLQYIKTHTRLLTRSLEWDKKSRDASFLLRGQDFLDAQQWLKAAGTKSPPPTSLQTDYIISSGQNQSKRQKVAIVGIGVGLVMACGLAIVAFFQYREAEARRVQVEELNAITLSSNANATFESNHQLGGLLASVKANQQLDRLNSRATMGSTYQDVENNLRQLLELILEENQLEGHQDLITNLRVSNNHEMIASASADNTVKLWRRDGSLIATLKGHTGTVWSATFSPDDKTIATSGNDRTVRLWNTDGTLLQTIPFASAVWSVSFSPTLDLLAIATADGGIHITKWDGTVVKSWQQDQGKVFSIRFSPDGTTILTGSGDKRARLWDLQGTLLHTFADHAGEVWAVRFSPNGQSIATGSADNTIKLWDLQGKLLQTFTGHQSGVISINFSPNGQHLVSGSADQTVRVWDLQGVPLNVFYHKDIVAGVDFLDDRTVVSGSYDKTIRIWQIDGELRQVLRGHQRRVLSAAISGDSRVIASSSTDGTVRMWKWTTKGAVFLRSLALSNRAASLANLELNDISLDQTGDRLAVGASDGRVYLWNQSGQLLHTLTGHTADVLSVAISPNGSAIASSSEDNTIRVWDWSGRTLHILRGHTEAVRAIAFSPDGTLLASASSDNTIKLWNVEQGTLVHTLQGHTAMVFSVAFAPDGQTLVSGGVDNTIRLWTVNGQSLRSFIADDAGITSVSFSPDGRFIASGGFDKSIKLWNLDGVLLRILTGHEQRVSSLQFSPNSQILISTGADKVVKVWDMSRPDISPAGHTDLMQASCDWLRNYLKNNPNVRESDRHICAY